MLLYDMIDRHVTSNFESMWYMFKWVMVQGTLLVKWVISWIEYQMKWCDAHWGYIYAFAHYWWLSTLRAVVCFDVCITDLGTSWGPCPQRILCEGMYDQDQVIRLEWWISVRKYTVQDRVATKTVNSCEEVYCPRPGKPSRAVIPCEVVHFPDQVIQRGTCRFWFRRELGCVWCSSESICYSRLWIFKFGFLCSMIIYWF